MNHHRIMAKGAAHDSDGELVLHETVGKKCICGGVAHTSPSKGVGRPKCSCGDMGPESNSERNRRAWHRGHARVAQTWNELREAGLIS